MKLSFSFSKSWSLQNWSSKKTKNRVKFTFLNNFLDCGGIREWRISIGWKGRNLRFWAGRLWGVKFALERVANLPSELSGAARRIQLPKSQKVGGHLHNAASSFGSIGDEFEPLFFLLLIFKVAKKKWAAAKMRRLEKAGTSQNWDFETKIESNLVLSAFSSREKTMTKKTDYS